MEASGDDPTKRTTSFNLAELTCARMVVTISTWKRQQSDTI